MTDNRPGVQFRRPELSRARTFREELVAWVGVLVIIAILGVAAFAIIVKLLEWAL